MHFFFFRSRMISIISSWKKMYYRLSKLHLSFRWKSIRNRSSSTQGRIPMSSNVIAGFHTSNEDKTIVLSQKNLICPILPFLAWGWTQRAKVARSSSSSTKSSWLPCCPRTPSTLRCIAVSPPSLRMRWRTRTTPWSCSVSSPPHAILVHDQGTSPQWLMLPQKRPANLSWLATVYMGPN